MGKGFNFEEKPNVVYNIKFIFSFENCHKTGFGKLLLEDIFHFIFSSHVDVILLKDKN